jgi:hypothetical protein
MSLKEQNLGQGLLFCLIFNAVERQQNPVLSEVRVKTDFLTTQPLACVRSIRRAVFEEKSSSLEAR